MKKIILISFLTLLASTIFIACNKDEDEIPTTGYLKGSVKDAISNAAIADVNILVFDANTNAPTDKSVKTDASGNYKIELLPGNYYLKLSKQKYNEIPAQGTSPVTAIVELDKETINDYTLQPSSVTDGGYVSGMVSAAGKPLAGALVIVENAEKAYSSVTGTDGKYVIFNIPAGSYTAKAYIADFTSPQINATVVANTETTNLNLALTANAMGSLTGTISFLATTNGEVEVALVHPLTKESIPGLSVKTLNGTYTLNKIPNGTYIARASFKNDGYVVDPDWIVKNGEPIVTLTGVALTQNFSVTGAVSLTSPTNDSTTTKPIEITSLTPTFSWAPYSSVNDYIIEVSDVNGNVIWGGFTKNAEVITKNIVIPKSQTSIVFNSDGKATAQLKKGVIYRWKIYASKDDAKEPLGWKLISVSEDQRGLFIVK